MVSQIFLILHGLNASDEALLVGFIKYFPPASHSVLLKGQQSLLDTPEEHD